MQPDRDQASLRQMLDCAREAVEMAGRHTAADLHSNRMLELALVRLIEIVGEAGNRVSPETQAHHPQLPWAMMVSMRNRLIHGYDEIDLNVVWDTVTQDLPPLIAQLAGIVGD